MTDRDVMQQALEALASYSIGERLDASQVNDLIAQLEAALEQKAEPVAWRYRGNLHEFDPSDWAAGEVIPLYTAPPAAQSEPPPEWEVINNIIAEYGLQAIDFVADWKATLEQAEPWGWYSAKADDFMTHSIRKEHERLGSHTHKVGKFDLPLYTSPPQRKWQGLTDEEMSDIVADIDVDFGDLLWKVVCLTKIIQATLKERNI